MAAAVTILLGYWGGGHHRYCLLLRLHPHHLALEMVIPCTMHSPLSVCATDDGASNGIGATWTAREEIHSTLGITPLALVYRISGAYPGTGPDLGCLPPPFTRGFILYTDSM